MQRFSDGADRLLRELFPGYAPALERARTSFRPVEIEGRDYSPRHDDKLLHVDAFPSRPLAGRRILRVFSNVADDGSVRKWRVGEPFADFAPRFLPRARALAPGAAWLMQQAGLTFLVVYADREHSANLSFLTGFDPRFEEAVLLLDARGHRRLLVSAVA